MAKFNISTLQLGDVLHFDDSEAIVHTGNQYGYVARRNLSRKDLMNWQNSSNSYNGRRLMKVTRGENTIWEREEATIKVGSTRTNQVKDVVFVPGKNTKYYLKKVITTDAKLLQDFNKGYTPYVQMGSGLAFQPVDLDAIIPAGTTHIVMRKAQ